eukprot:CAMPEP_0172070200 /NCGR_PEP_ID=MMETSP1043-20130122/13140_1 /TAXON_ID=464988 /ORGANISM="Hemiselmis andersenii, Strain CCMP441" /LENGTH=130 /DNA_ID=CAMNT_0012730555 /DNA_START=42 /DNA_END=436 /DNA_ORIENTATION=-
MGDVQADEDAGGGLATPLKEMTFSRGTDRERAVALGAARPPLGPSRHPLGGHLLDVELPVVVLESTIPIPSSCTSFCCALVALLLRRPSNSRPNKGIFGLLAASASSYVLLRATGCSLTCCATIFSTLTM